MTKGIKGNERRRRRRSDEREGKREYERRDEHREMNEKNEVMALSEKFVLYLHFRTMYNPANCASFPAIQYNKS